MDPHFWQTLYPGILIGVLLGVAVGGWQTILAGGIGGLAGATASLGISHLFIGDDGTAALLVMILCCAVGAGLAIMLVRTWTRGVRGEQS